MIYYTSIYVYVVIDYKYTHYGTLTLLIQPYGLVPLRLVLPAVDGHRLLHIYACGV